jgi:O-acetyl-ADP-ribose deacetylase (regulator of RNase III)
MSLEILRGNIFTSECQTIVNTVNCVGVMGAGIALECRLRYPEMYSKYKTLCAEQKFDIGLLWLFRAPDRWVLNFPTKMHWKYPSKTEYLHAGLSKFLDTYKNLGIESIAFPLLGADRGGIDQNISLDIMTEYLDKADIQVEIYQYDNQAKDDLFEKTKDWLLSNSAEDIMSLTKLRRNNVEAILDALGYPGIVQLNQLTNIDGIGIKTLEKLFIAARGPLFDDVSPSIGQQTLF